MQTQKRIILASQSPRRKELLSGLGISYEVIVRDVNEDFPASLQAQEIPLYLCKKKAEAYNDLVDENTLIITADTVVWINGQVLNKPANLSEATAMLKLLSGNMHQVFTGVNIKSHHGDHSFYSESKVYFKNLTNEEIHYYLENFKPLDKAGSYGVQEWIGYMGISRIEGSYYNIMGLPTLELYEALTPYLQF